MPIRILHVVGTMNRGGAETFLMNVLRNIDRSRFQFIFLCYGEEKFDYEDEIIKLGGKIVRTPDVKNIGILKHIKNIQEMLLRERINIVQAHTCFNSVFSLIAAKNVGIKCRVAHSHNTLSESGASLAKKIYFNFSKFIINRYSTDYLACGRDAGNYLFYEKSKFTIVSNGIILDDFYYREPVRIKLRKDLKISNSTSVLLHVGRFDEQKNQSFLIDVFIEYQKMNSDAKLIFVGDGILRPDIEGRVADLDAKEKIIFLGKRSDVSDLYNIADVFVFPSLHEGLPVTLVEAQTNGLACFISDSIDTSTKLTDCVSFYSLTRSPLEWARAIDQLDVKRRNTSRILKNSSYNMARNIKNIERMYIDMQVKGLEL